MIEPQYEWINTCEVVPFGKAFSKRYIQNLFSGPGLIGYLKGHAKFSFTIFPLAFISRTPVKLSFDPSVYSTPIFGTKELTKSDFRTIAFSHFMNSLNVVRDNRDENMLDEFLNINNEIAHLFEERYQMNAEDLVSIIQKVSGIENHRVD